MIEFFSWFKSGPWDKKPWLILGKGPSLARHREFANLDERFNTFGLNHVCRERHTLVTHVIDVNVIGEIQDLEHRTDFLVMARHPHVQFKPTEKTLEQFVAETPALQGFDLRGRLIWYNLSSWSKPHESSPVVKVGWFSAEAAVGLLAMAGVRQIRTLGIDGGNKYAEAFKDISPFRGGHKTFDHQNKPIEDIVKKFGLDYGPLLEERGRP